MLGEIDITQTKILCFTNNETILFLLFFCLFSVLCLSRIQRFIKLRIIYTLQLYHLGQFFISWIHFTSLIEGRCRINILLPLKENHSLPIVPSTPLRLQSNAFFRLLHRFIQFSHFQITRTQIAMQSTRYPPRSLLHDITGVQLQRLDE